MHLSRQKLARGVIGGLLLVCHVHAAQLTDWSAASSNTFRFHLRCESEENYLIQWSPDLTNWIDWARNTERSTNRVVAVPTSLGSKAFWRALLTEEPMFGFALKAKDGIELGGYNIRIDSFDSTRPAYSTDGRYDPAKATDHAKVAARNDSGTNGINLDRTVLLGSVFTGTNGGVTLGPNGVVGDAAYAANLANAGTIQPGHSAIDPGLNFPDVVLPAGSSTWPPLPNPAFVVVDGIIYKYLLTTGDYLIAATNGPMSAEGFYIEGTVRLRVDSEINLTGQDTLRIGTNSSLQIFGNCASAKFAGNGIINQWRPSAFRYFGTSRNTVVSIGGNNETTGAFYAPYADGWLAGGGSGTSDYSGSFVFRSIRVFGHFNSHFDESLASSPDGQ